MVSVEHKAGPGEEGTRLFYSALEQGLLEIGDQIIGVFKPNGDA
jgi:hypothetical protein